MIENKQQAEMLCVTDSRPQQNHLSALYGPMTTNPEPIQIEMPSAQEKKAMFGKQASKGPLLLRTMKTRPIRSDGFSFVCSPPQKKKFRLFE